MYWRDKMTIENLEIAIIGILITLIWVLACFMFLIGSAAILQIFTTRFAAYKTVVITVDTIEYRVHHVVAIVQYSNKIIVINYKHEKVFVASGYKQMSWVID